MITEFYYRPNSLLARTMKTLLGQTSLPVVRMSGRRSPDIPDRCVRSTTLAGLAILAIGRLVPYPYRRGWNIVQNRFFGVLVAAISNCSRFDSIYGLNSEVEELFRWAKGCGKRCYLEQVSYPKEQEQALLAQEHTLWPGWEAVSRERFVRPYAERERREWALADRIICMSDFVARGLRAEGVDADKVAVVPYGLDTSRWNVGSRTRDQCLRVLFAGGVRLHKGIQYLYQAATMLNAGPYTFRAVGPVHLRNAAAAEVARRVELVGAVPRSTMPRQYHAADVLVLPSISEGYGWVTHEAMATGLPVITTKNAAGIVRDGIDGFVVPIRDPEAIADRLERLRSDRALYASMAANARQRAATYGSIEAYTQRLVGALQCPGRIPNPPSQTRMASDE
jgi:glycosyltransferase involved in cell wall biosynthesis